MTFRLRIDPIAQQRIDQFASYLRHYSEEFAIQQIDRLDYILHSNLGEAPLSSTSKIFSCFVDFRVGDPNMALFPRLIA